jgi:hypothetical protein
MRKTIEGVEAYTPATWTPVTIGLVCALLLAIAECFRSEIVVRIGAMLVTAVLGAISFIPLRNLFLTYAGMAYLKVSRSGISYRYGKIAADFAWTDMQSFRAVEINPKLSLIRITLSDAAKPPESAKVPGLDGILLPDLYDWKPSELADYLARQKERYSNSGPTPREIYEK